jgi:hypothetical protein
MGVNISHNIKLTKDFSCSKCCTCDSYSETNPKININKINDTINNNINNFDTNEKMNTFSPEQEKLYYKNKLKKIIFEKHLSSITNSSKTDILNVSSIQIQSYIRGFLLRKKLKQKIIFNKLNNVKSINENEKDSEEENIKNVEIEDNLVISLSMNGTIFTGDNSIRSSRSITAKLNKFTFNNDMSRFLINKNIFTFNLKSKNNIKYKYYGFLKQKNKQSYINTTGIINNNNYNDTKIKNGFGKLSFEDNSTFKCNFIENKANGIGQYIDKNNSEEFIGEYKNNVPNGYGIYQNIISERKCMGYFKSNGLNGIGIEESVEDGYTYHGEFDKNQKHGYGMLQWKEGIKYEGQFSRGQMTGYAIVKYCGYNIYKGQMINGKMEGFGEFNWAGGKKYIGYYKNDRRNGFGIFLWKIPKINIDEGLSDLNNIKGYIGFWSDGNMDGLGLRISDGKIKYGLWKNGIKMEWIEGDEHIKKHIDNNQRQYVKLFLSTKQKLLNLLSICAAHDKDNIIEEAEFEMN